MRALLYFTLTVALSFGCSPTRGDQAPDWLQGLEAGPHPIRVLRVDDDGSVWGVAHVDGYVLPSWWRISGMDMPRPGRGAGCPDERSRADAATRSMRWLMIGKPVTIMALSDSPEPRHLAGRIILSDGRDLSEALIGWDLARRKGSTERDPWCGW